jgi:hypothetical protein
MLPLPRQFLVAWLGVWFASTLQQQQVDYVRAENQILKEKLGDRKLDLTNADRRKHQGLGNALIDGISADTDGLGPVARRERLGGLLNFYYREAA